MKKREWKKVKIILVILTMVLVGVILYANKKETFDGYYIYPTPDTFEGWNDLTVKEKIELCRIPPKILESMSDEQLMQAILDYPFLCEIHLYPTMEYGVEVLERICDAYAELIERECGLKTMMNLVKQRAVEYMDGITAEVEIQNDALATMILYQVKFQDKLTDDEKELIESISRLVQNYEKDREEEKL